MMGSDPFRVSRFAQAAGVVVGMIGAGLAVPHRAEAQIDVRGEVFYHFMPIAWRDSDADPQRFGDFAGMEASLDYLQALGITAVWMNPIFPSPAYHGYQHGRADELNPRFGTESQWRSFVQAAHARGIKVFVDFVVYGISHESPWFQSAYANPSSQYDAWLAFTNHANTNYLGSVYPTWSGDAVGFIHWDLRRSETFELIASWGRKWLDPDADGDLSDGVDGYRLDHVWVNYPNGPDGWGYNLTDFWEPWKAELRSVNPDVFIFAEQADWGSMGVELLTAFDASMTKPFEFAAREALATQSAAPLYASMATAVASVPADRTFMGIIGDHDVDRLASAIGGGFPRARAGAAVLMAQPFTPMVYFGDEIGMLGTKKSYGGDANDIPMREPFKWNAVAGPPMSDYWALHETARDNAFSTDNDGRSVEEQEGVGGSLLETYRELIATRRASPALTHGGYIPVTASRPGVWAFVRQHADQDVLVVINLTDQEELIFCDLSDFELTGGSTRPEDLITGWLVRTVTETNQAAWPLVLQPYSYGYFELALEPFAPPASDADGRDIPSDFGPDALVATQNTPTVHADNTTELNQMFVAFGDEALRVGITGNLATDGTGFVLLLDTVPGGQSVLDFSGYAPPPSGPQALTGGLLDPGFEPDTMLFVNAPSGVNAYVDQFTLHTDGGVTKVYRGSTIINSGAGTLSGGTNPDGLRVALDNSNTAGVTTESVSGADTATTGFEIVIPYSYLGLQGGGQSAVGIGAFVMEDGLVSSQCLPGVSSSLLFFEIPPDMTEASGAQFAVVSPPPVGCAGDLDGDADTDVFDFAAFATGFGQSVEPGTGGDLDASGLVDVLDFAILAGDFGCVR